MIRAYGYVRVSGKGQTTGHGPARQRELIAAFAKRRFEIVAVFEDAHTGTEDDRPQFTEMLGQMMANGVKTVVVESLDRLARDLLIQSTLLAKLAAEGLTLIAANTGEDVTAAMQDDPMRKAMVQIQGVFSELDRNLIVRKLRIAREAIRAEFGRCEGAKPFGDLPGEAKVVDRIKALKSEKLSLQKIANALNADLANYPPRKAPRWSKMLVKGVLDRASKVRGVPAL